MSKFAVDQNFIHAKIYPLKVCSHALTWSFAVLRGPLQVIRRTGGGNFCKFFFKQIFTTFDYFEKNQSLNRING